MRPAMFNSNSIVHTVAFIFFLTNEKVFRISGRLVVPIYIFWSDSEWKSRVAFNLPWFTVSSSPLKPYLRTTLRIFGFLMPWFIFRSTVYYFLLFRSCSCSNSFGLCGIESSLRCLPLMIFMSGSAYSSPSMDSVFSNPFQTMAIIFLYDLDMERVRFPRLELLLCRPY